MCSFPLLTLFLLFPSHESPLEKILLSVLREGFAGLVDGNLGFGVPLELFGAFLEFLLVEGLDVVLALSGFGVDLHSSFVELFLREESGLTYGAGGENFFGDCHKLFLFRYHLS